MGLRIKEFNETSSLSTDDYIIVDDGKETKKAKATSVLASTAALNAKQDLLVSGTNIKTINGSSILGLGNLTLASDKASVGLGNVDNTSDTNKPISTATQTALDSKLAMTNNAGFHNSIFRGKYLGTSVTSTQYAQISAGTFDDLYIGDYWTINSVNWRIAGFDYWYNQGNKKCTTHHIVIVPDTCLLIGDGEDDWFNTANTTSGAYVGSDWYTGNNSNTGRSQVTTIINNAFGSAHILTHKEYLKNAVTNGYESGGAWYDSTHEFMTEQMVYGCKVFGNILNEANIPDSQTISNSQLPLFRLAPQYVCNGIIWWLRDVVSATHFAAVYFNGTGRYEIAASMWVSVRVAFGIKA